MEGSQTASVATSNFGPEAYIEVSDEQFTGFCQDDEYVVFILNVFHEIFEKGKISGERLLDIGSVPVSHQVFAASKWFREIVLSDLWEANLDTLRDWKLGRRIQGESIFKYMVSLGDSGSEEEEGATSDTTNGPEGTGVTGSVGSPGTRERPRDPTPSTQCTEGGDDLPALEVKRTFAQQSLKDRRSLDRDGSKLFQPPTFDQLFQSGGQVRFPNNRSVDTTTSFGYGRDSCRTKNPPTDVERDRVLPRVDSVMQQTFTEMLTKNRQNTTGFMGFRRRVASEISHKYSSNCTFYENSFIFLHVLLGMAATSAGFLCLKYCGEETMVFSFLIVEGVLSVLIFPVSIITWTETVGGCVAEDPESESWTWFTGVLIARVVSAVAGTVILTIRDSGHVPSADDDWTCQYAVDMLKAMVVFEWLFLTVGIVLPLVLFFGLFITARVLHLD